MFRKIADEPASPWSGVAPYLVARTLIREATLGVEGEGVNEGPLAAAEEQLRKLLSDPGRKAVRPAAQRLLNYVEARLHPDERMHELAGMLVRKDSQTNIQQNLIDYRFLYDQFEAGKYGGIKALPLTDDLTDWISAFQSGGKAVADQAVEKWRATGALPWLVAALAKTDAGNAAVPDLLTAAGAVGNDSPAYAAVQFHAIRLLIEAGRDNDARAQVDQVLSARRALPASSVNLFRAERMKLAESWDDFLKYAPRTAAGANDGTGEADLRSTALPEGIAPQSPAFDTDSARILNEQTPLALLADAAHREILPRPLRREVALAVWTRAVLLRQEQISMSVAPVLAELAPELKQPLDSYAGSRDAKARTFAAVCLMLKFPGMHPYVRMGFGRLLPIAKMDSLRDNWWCAFTRDENSFLRSYYRGSTLLSAPLQALYQDDKPLARFLSPPQKESGEREWSGLSGVPTAPDYLAAQTVEWAKGNPDDPRVPEALHLAVRAGRYGCGAGKSPASEQAFRLLHQRYPNSEWAEKTKYWY